VNLNGSQRGFPPFFAFLPKRIKDIMILEGAEWTPVITDDFLITPHPGKCDPNQIDRIVLPCWRRTLRDFSFNYLLLIVF
jgi:hypothetical protein